MDVLVEKGDRVAQLIIEKIETPEVLEVEVRLFDTLDAARAEVIIRNSKRLFAEQVALGRLVVTTIRNLQGYPRCPAQVSHQYL
jgi:hypothetical protein